MTSTVQRYRHERIAVGERAIESRQQKIGKYRCEQEPALKLKAFERGVQREGVQEWRAGGMIRRWIRLTGATVCAGGRGVQRCRTSPAGAVVLRQYVTASSTEGRLIVGQSAQRA